MNIYSEQQHRLLHSLKITKLPMCLKEWGNSSAYTIARLDRDRSTSATICENYVLSIVIDERGRFFHS